MTDSFAAYNSSSWQDSNLVRLPIAWAKGSKDNSTNVLFTTNESFPPTNWDYDTNYFATIGTIVNTLLSDNKVVIIDLHTYGKWFYDNIFTSDTSIGSQNKLALIWGHILQVFDNNNIFKDNRVWFELMNEPYVVQDFTLYHQAVNQIRNNNSPYALNTPYTNKILLGLDATSPYGKLVVSQNDGTTVTGLEFSDLLNLPSDSNLCVVLHQYFDVNGSGTTNTMVQNWPNLSDGSTLSQLLTNLRVNNDKCDFILGEFGYSGDTNTTGQTSVQTLLNALETSNNSITVSSNILTQTIGGLWLGFSVWQMSGGTASFSENFASNTIYTNTYSQYFT